MPFDIVGDAIFRILVGADVDADDAAPPAPALEPRQRRRVALIVEAHAVDDGFILRQPEQARPRIADLRPWRHRADFHKAEAQRQHGVGHFGILVEAGAQGPADWESRDRTASAARPGSRVRGAGHCGIACSALIVRRCAFSASRAWRSGRASWKPCAARLMRPSSAGKHVSAIPAARVSPTGQRPCQAAIEMREKIAAARWLPAQVAQIAPPSKATSSSPSWPAKWRRAVSRTCCAVERWMKPSADRQRSPRKAPARLRLAPVRRREILVEIPWPLDHRRPRSAGQCRTT